MQYILMKFLQILWVWEDIYMNCSVTGLQMAVELISILKTASKIAQTNVVYIVVIFSSCLASSFIQVIV